MGRIALVTLHGMGESDRHYADGLWRGVRERLAGADASVDLHPVYYQHILQPNQQRVWERLREHRLRWTGLRRFVLFGLADAAGLENRKEEPGSVYELAQIEIARTLLSAMHAVGPGGAWVAVAQSLGGQVLSSYLWDAQKAAAGPRALGIWRDIDAHAAAIAGRALSAAEKRFVAGNSLRAIVTTGCNIPVFVAAHKEMVIKPIRPPTPGFRWLNFFDADDVLAWPLQPLSDGYRRLVEDRRINATAGIAQWLLRSWNPLSHTAYWRDGDVASAVAALLLAASPDRATPLRTAAHGSPM